MFPISSDGVFEDPSIFFDQDKFLEDLLVDFDFPTSSEGNDHGENVVMKKRPRKASSSGEVPDDNKGRSSDSKKSAHRFTEKQRRQEMAALHASLRSLLPLQYIKGKRAISDHMHQAVNYINDMKKKIEEMQIKRESLRKLQYSNVGSSSGAAVESGDHRHNYSSSTRDLSDCVKINHFKDGLMEILISSSINRECFPLSMVLADLLGRELNVIHCVSTRIDRFRYLHKIQIEVRSID
ncbi:hypothetical protein C2S52_007971 [Perilla frutescens var. hirtella]|nr:hypothetical protein C2S52_007971 [Perilla frutescens var. hirtella]